MNDVQLLIEYSPFLIPLVILQYGLAIYTIVHIVRHPNYQFGNRPMWIIIALVFGFIGPLVYFVFGKGKDA